MLKELKHHARIFVVGVWVIGPVERVEHRYTGW